MLRKALCSALSLAIFAGLPLLLWAATANDNFNRGNGGLGANWTTVAAGLVIDQQHVSHGGSAQTEANSYYSGTAFTADQAAQVSVSGFGAGNCGMVAVRMSAGVTGYKFTVCDGAGDWCGIEDEDGALAESTCTVQVGDLLRLQAIGTSTVQLTAKIIRGGSDIKTLTASDTVNPITSGQPGIGIWRESLWAWELDDFSAEDIGGAPPARKRVVIIE